MGVPISLQLSEAVSSLLVGIAAGMAYDLFRMLRRAFRLRAVTHILDALFGIFFTLSLLSVTMGLGYGQQRIVYTLIAAGSFLLYGRTVSPSFSSLLLSLTRLTGKMTAFLLRPLKYADGKRKKFQKSAKNIFHYNLKWYRIVKKYKIAENFRKTESDGGTTDEAHIFKYTYEDTAGRSADIRGSDSRHHVRKNQRRAGGKTASGTEGGTARSRKR